MQIEGQFNLQRAWCWRAPVAQWRWERAEPRNRSSEPTKAPLDFTGKHTAYGWILSYIDSLMTSGYFVAISLVKLATKLQISRRLIDLHWWYSMYCVVLHDFPFILIFESNASRCVLVNGQLCCHYIGLECSYRYQSKNIPPNFLRKLRNYRTYDLDSKLKGIASAK